MRNIFPRHVAWLLAFICIGLASAHAGEYCQRYSILDRKPFLLGPTGIRAYGPHSLHRDRLEKQGHEIRSDFVVTSIDPNAPAEGLILKYDVIIGANGKRFPEGGDPRVDLGWAIIDSEAAEGNLTLTIVRNGKTQEVTIRLAPIGGYSSTWPFDCPRTDQMVDDAARYLSEEQMPDGHVPADEAYIGTVHAGLFWLGTGEPKYLENARRAAYWFMDHITEKEKQGEPVRWGPWFVSSGGMLLAEYFQMTGDRNVLPGLELCAKQIARGQMPSGSWGHNFFDGYHAGYGEVNNSGLSCWIALELSRECGVKVDGDALIKARHFFGRYALPLTSHYGDHDPGLDGYGTSNGKIGKSAIAHFLQGSELAAAQFTLKAARAMDRAEDGHTGCYYNIMWTPVAASFAPAEEYRRAMDQFGWYYALSRTPRGGLFCQYGGDNLPRTSGEYSDVGPNMTSGGIGLALVAPRRHLRILGAPKSVFLRKDLPGPLQKARELHQKNDWAGCQTLVKTYLQEANTSPELLPQTNELMDKSRYVQASVEGTLPVLAEMVDAKKRRFLDLQAYETHCMLQPLKRLLGADDSRIKAIEDVIPDSQTPVFMRGKAYYEACRTINAQANESWWIYGRMAQDATRELVAKRIPRPWTTLGDTQAEGVLRTTGLAKGAEVPAGWAAVGFDDSEWAAGMPKGKAQNVDSVLIRAQFKYESSRIARIRLAIKEALPGGTKIYLNGEEVMDVKSPIKAKKEVTVELLPKSIGLLRSGENVLCIRAAGKLKPPRVAIEATVLGNLEHFAWTSVPGRDDKMRTLTAKRMRPTPYYDAETDTRTVEQVAADLNKKDVFIPDLACTLKRYRALVPNMEERHAAVGKLLKSESWGGRLAGLTLMAEAVSYPQNYRKMNDAAKAEARAAAERPQAVYGDLLGLVAGCIKDPNLLVREESAKVLGAYGPKASQSLETLAALVVDTSEDWWVRRPAWDAVWAMNPKPETTERVMRAILRDPSATMLSAALGESIRLKDGAARLDAARTYKEEILVGVFEAPLAMWTRSARLEMARNLKALGKDEVRPYLPKFFGALKHPRGGALEGSTEILAMFGEEVMPKLEKLADGEDATVAMNALKTLTMMVETDAVKPDASAKITERLEAAKTSTDIEMVRTAKACLQKIADAKNTNEKDK